MLVPAKYHIGNADSSAIWCWEATGLQLGALWTEKRAGYGEDAEPTLIYHVPSRRGIIAVYDGLGGAGAHKIGTSTDGRNLSHAYVASRLARISTATWFKERIEAGNKKPLIDVMNQTLQAIKYSRSSSLSGTVSNNLPSTIASIEFNLSKDDEIDLTLRWAGDSRCQLFLPEEGLEQLSTDDVEGVGSFYTLNSDHVLSNFISASKPYVIHERPWKTPVPCLLLCATDGAFSYFDTPAMFEFGLVDSLVRSKNLSGWLMLLAKQINFHASDDASIVLAGIGFSSFDELKRRCRRRRNDLYADHWLPLNAAADNQRNLNAARQRSWATYKQSYLKNLELEER